MKLLLTTLFAGCGCLLLIALAGIVAILFFIGFADGVEHSSNEDYSSGSHNIQLQQNVELVDLLIDGGCKEGEQFHEEDKTCGLLITCGTTEQCARWGDKLVAQLEEKYGSLTAEETVATEEETIVFVEYAVDLKNELLTTDAPVNDATLQYDSSLWYSYAWLIPEHARPEVTRFEVFDSGEKLAYIYLHDDLGVEWTLGINRNRIELASETMVTYLHEYAHLLSLRGTEADYFVTQAQCDSYYLEDSCFYEDAYLTAFYEQFYEANSYDYTTEYFISEYAMSTIFEDFAESFAHFVLSEQPDGDNVTQQKLLFFYQYEYLVQLRAEILARVATWLDRTVETIGLNCNVCNS